MKKKRKNDQMIFVKDDTFKSNQLISSSFYVLSKNPCASRNHKSVDNDCKTMNEQINEIQAKNRAIN